MSTWYAVGRDAHKTAAAGEDWFHGSTYELPFDRFDLTKDRQHQYGQKHWNSYLGAHFTSEHHTAAQIGLEGNGHVYHVDLAMKNPKHYDSEFHLDTDAHHWAQGKYPGIKTDAEYKAEGIYPSAPSTEAEQQLRQHPQVRQIAAGFRDHLRSQGHDGITYGNEFEGSERHPCAIAFHSDDIAIKQRHYPDSHCEEGTVCSHCDWPLPKQSYGECSNCGEHVDWHDQHSARPDDHAADGKVASLTNYPQPEEHGFYEYRPAPGEGGQGRRGLGDAGAGRRGPQARARRVGAGLARDAAGGTGGDGASGSLTPEPTWHSAAAKDMKRLDGPVRKQMQATIDKIVAGDPGTMAQTHPLIGPMKGWMATKGSRGHRVIHRPNADGGIHIGYVGLHEYDKAIQRLTSRTAGHYDTPEGHVTLYRGLHFGPMDDAERKHMHTDPVGYLQHEQPHHRSLGIHWTQDMDSAYHFAMGQDPHGNNDEDYSHYEDEDGSVHPGGMILEAHVPKHHIVEHGTKEWQDYADSDAIFHPDHPEAETTVRDSSSLHVHRIHTISHDQAKNAWAPPTVESHDVSLHKQATKTAGASQGALPWGRFQQALSTFPTHPDYHHQDRAAGRCVQAADAFVDHAGVGSRVTLMHATDGLHMDANAWPKTEGAAAVHTVARVPTERGDQAVDWTARQFDAGASVPHVEPWDDFASRWESHT